MIFKHIHRVQVHGQTRQNLLSCLLLAGDVKRECQRDFPNARKDPFSGGGLERFSSKINKNCVFFLNCIVVLVLTKFSFYLTL